MTFWKNRRVLVTGGHGFLGSHVAKSLKKKGALVYTPSHREFNLVDGDQISKMYNKYPSDMVIHLAARVGGIKGNRDHPAEYYYDNVMMGTQMLHQAYQRGIPKFVAFGTVCSYPKLTPVPFKEKDLWKGYPEKTTAPYGIAKKMMLVQSQTYRQQYGYNSIFLLPVNLYGPGDNFHKEETHVVPALIKKCVAAAENNDKTIEVWGDGRQTREFLYVEDAAEGIILAAELYNKSRAVNLGSGFEISIKELVTLIAKFAGFKGEFIWNTNMPAGQPRRKLDTSRAEAEFGFKASTNFEQGLEKTVKWYKQNKRSAK